MRNVPDTFSIVVIHYNGVFIILIIVLLIPIIIYIVIYIIVYGLYHLGKK